MFERLADSDPVGQAHLDCFRVGMDTYNACKFPWIRMVDRNWRFEEFRVYHYVKNGL